MKFQNIKSIKSLGIQNTLDFEVDNKNHNFYANDIVVSNSHAISYATMSAATTYLKFKYPKEFFLCLLQLSKEEQNPIDEIKIIENEMKYFGIKLLGPHLINSGIDFQLEGDNIRFGIGNIKGISDKTLEKLRHFCHSFSSKFEIFSAAKECGISISVLQNLILAGTMDDYLTQTRTKTCLEAALYNLLTPREQKYIQGIGKDFGYDLIEIIKYLSQPQNGSEKPFIKESRLTTLRSKFIPHKNMYNNNSINEQLLSYTMEKELLGFSYSQVLVDILKKAYPDIISINEVLTALDDERVLIGGEVSEYKEGTSKNKNKYIRMKIGDGTENINTMLMEKHFDENNNLNNGKKIENKDIVMVYGRKKGDIVFADKIVSQNAKILIKPEKEIEKSVDS